MYFHCNERGHRAFQCQKEVKLRDMYVATRIMIAGGPKIRKHLYFAGHLISVVMDPASDITTMSQSQQPRMGLPSLKEGKIAVQGFHHRHEYDSKRILHLVR